MKQPSLSFALSLVLSVPTLASLGACSSNGNGGGPGGPDGNSAVVDAAPGTPDAAPPGTPDAHPPGTPDAHPGSPDAMPGGAHIKTVFLILMENHNWNQIEGSSSAPYINNTLLPLGASAKAYMNPPGNHPSEPNYIWLEAGSNLTITNDNDPSSNHKPTTMHLSTLLNNKGVTWRAYQEGITGTTCPITGSGLYAPKHNPFMYFDDTDGFNAGTGKFNATDAYCLAHERPYSELAGDLTGNKVAQYNFITPDLCDDGHNSLGCTTIDAVKNGDVWLSQEVPKILASNAYKDGGVILITWDEGELNSDGPIGMIILSPNVKSAGYTNTIAYTHSSTLRTMEEIFGVTPLLGDAANATSLKDFFKVYP